MDGPIRKNLIHQIDVFVKKYPLASAKDVKRFILSGSCVDLKKVSKNTLKQFIFYHMMKIKKTGSCLERVHGSGRPKSVTGKKQNVTKVLKLCLEKETPGLRSVSKKLDISLGSVWNILKQNGVKAYHKQREQAFTKDHKVGRVKYGKWLLNNLLKMTLFFKTSLSIFSLRFWTLEHKIKSV